MPRTLILTGGPAHEYDRTAPMVAEILGQAGVEAVIREDFGLVEERRLVEFDFLTLYCTRATYKQVPRWTEQWHFELSETARQEITALLERGGGLLALHAASGCFDDWPEYKQILGAWWEGGKSSHPPVQEHLMMVNRGAHSIVAGVEDFPIVDELFIDLEFAAKTEPLIESVWQGKRYPVSWVREYGGGRVFYNGLGHGDEALRNPSLRTIIQRGALWLVGSGPSRAQGGSS